MITDLSSLHPGWLVIGSLSIALLPALVGLFTSYLKVSIVLGFLKGGLGTQQVPGTVVTLSLAVALTLFVMGPVLTQVSARCQTIDTKIFTRAPNQQSLVKLREIAEPFIDFMRKHAGTHEMQILGAQVGEDSSMRVLITSFMLSELREAFAMGFVLLLPFLVIDLVVSNILAGMGMFMVSPTIISLPLKLLLFAVSDGWILLGKSLIASYN